MRSESDLVIKCWPPRECKIKRVYIRVGVGAIASRPERWWSILELAEVKGNFDGRSQLGSRVDEERGNLRYVMRIAELSESSYFWTHTALWGLSGPIRVYFFEHGSYHVNVGQPLRCLDCKTVKLRCWTLFAEMPCAHNFRCSNPLGVRD